MNAKSCHHAAIAALLLAFSVNSNGDEDKHDTRSAPKPEAAVEENFSELDSLILSLLKSDGPETRNQLHGGSGNIIHHEVHRGESIDAIVRKYYGRLPFKPSLMKRLITRLNPHAIMHKDKTKLLAGKTLTLPDATLVRTALLRDTGTPPAPQSDTRASSQDAEADSSTWVRYP